MGSFAIGDIVLVNFPYSDMTKLKKRPALVVGIAEFGDLILAQITSTKGASKISIELSKKTITASGLLQASFVRPDKIATLALPLIDKNLGALQENEISQVKKRLVEVLDV